MTTPLHHIQHYLLEVPIGQGAMGDVYRARDTRTQSLVALKVLKPALSTELSEPLARFQREGELLRQLDHPNIVKLLDVVTENHLHALVMEYVSGGTLRDLLNHQPQPPVERVLAIALELADALTRAHHLDIIHRDLKPGNVLLKADGSPALMDFGLAYNLGQSDISQVGTLVGTPHYLCPEAFEGVGLNQPSDIWSFGVLLYEMLAGEVPFDGTSFATLAAAICEVPVPDLEARRPDVPPALIDLIYRVLEKDRKARLPSMRLVGSELEAIIRGADLSEIPLPKPQGSEDGIVQRRDILGGLLHDYYRQAA